MANRELIAKGSTDQTIKIDSSDFKILIQELIRLDVPIMEIGSSSIGKSYSIRQFAEECGVNNEFLFVGTEKSEFIEGIPNLKGVTGDTAKFSYLKPYWFPDKEEIRSRLVNGKSQLESLLSMDGNINSLYQSVFSGTGNYSMLKDLKIAIQAYRRTESEVKSAKAENKKISKYVYVDALLYISTIQGFGNFWLILDEIDKVEKQDKDKYAPLLHIVRERELKGWKLSGMREYPEYDIKFVNTVILRKERLDAALQNPDVDVTDTRIIAIANDLQVMEKEAPALYRRFVKMIINTSLYDERKIKLPSGDPNIPVGYDWATQFEVERQNLHSCIVVKEIPVEGGSVDSGIEAQKGRKKKAQEITIGEKMAEIEPEKCGKPLEEMNLQWTLGFFPDILFPGKDSTNQGDGFVSNDIITNYNKTDDPYKTLIFKILSDNFDGAYWKPMLTCIHDQISTKITMASASQERKDDVAMFYDEAGVKDMDTATIESVMAMTDRYAKKLASVEAKFKESLDVQKGLTAGTEETVGLDQTLLKRAFDSVKFGFDLIDASLKGGKTPTEVTRMLFSSIPFIQTKFIANSPYIAFDGASELTDVQDKGIIDLIERITGAEVKDGTTAKDASTELFKILEPHRSFIVKYAVAIPSSSMDAVVEGDYNKVSVTDELVKEIIANRPVMIDNMIAGKIKDDKLKQEYYNSISNVKLLEKETLNNLPGVSFPMLINEFDANGISSELKTNVQYYVEKFPFTMDGLADAPNTPSELGAYIKERTSVVIDNINDYSVSELDLIKQ